MSEDNAPRFKRRKFLRAASAVGVGSVGTGTLVSRGRAATPEHVTVYVYQNAKTPSGNDDESPENDSGRPGGAGLAGIVQHAKNGLKGTLDDLVDRDVFSGYSLVDRTDVAVQDDVGGNCPALEPFNVWLWDQGFTEGTGADGSDENAAHILLRDTANDNNPGGCASGANVYYGDDYRMVTADYDGDGTTERREAVPRAVVSQDVGNRENASETLSNVERIETATAHEFGHLVVEGGRFGRSNCWSKTFDVDPSGSREHALGTYSDVRDELSIMSRFVPAAGANKRPCKNATDQSETGLWHSDCYVELAECTQDYYNG